MSGFLQWLRIGAITAFLLLLVWFGVMGGMQAIGAVRTVGQGIAAATQVAFGIASAATIWAIWKRSGWLETSLLVWAVAIVVTGTLAPVVWGRSGWVNGAYFGIVSLFIAAIVWWGCTAHATWMRVRHKTRVTYYA
jgi:hypothetical protein